MDDYRLVQIAELEKKIEETKELLLDPQMSELVSMELASLEVQKKELEDSVAESMRSKPVDFDQRNVILEIKGAAGGDEANMWAAELGRMYVKYAENKGFKVEGVDENVFKVSGNNAFGLFKFEAGVH